jgi:outer membrane biosynthesis protein TonB
LIFKIKILIFRFSKVSKVMSEIFQRNLEFTSMIAHILRITESAINQKDLHDDQDHQQLVWFLNLILQRKDAALTELAVREAATDLVNKVIVLKKYGDIDIDFGGVSNSREPTPVSAALKVQRPAQVPPNFRDILMEQENKKVRKPSPVHAEPAVAPEPEAAAAPEPEPAVAPEPEPAVAPEPEPAAAPEPEPAAAPEPEPAAAAAPEDVKSFQVCYSEFDEINNTRKFTQIAAKDYNNNWTKRPIMTVKGIPPGCEMELNSFYTIQIPCGKYDPQKVGKDFEFSDLVGFPEPIVFEGVVDYKTDDHGNIHLRPIVTIGGRQIKVSSSDNHVRPLGLIDPELYSGKRIRFSAYQSPRTTTYGGDTLRNGPNMSPLHPVEII